MLAPTKHSQQIFHMSLVEPLIIIVLSLCGVGLSAGFFIAGVGDFIKTIVLLLISTCGLLVALTMTRKLEIRKSELIISYLVSKRVIAREDIDAYFQDEQGVNRRTRKFVTIHLVNGQRIKFKAIKEGNDSLLQALEIFTGLEQAADFLEESAKTKN